MTMVVVGKLIAKPKRWVNSATFASAILCAAVSFFSWRAAEAISDWSADLIVKHGFPVLFVAD
ncbi:hypothetical protein IP68_12420 [Blastomonas sp. AAP25]|uniref:hypothetical protein n=1 Tax=Blastomonas sp. AAP25 TaxID=1523416 RepID=UPI0006CC99EC|nr:hypothetical protein [Blastomonas sp. AAP25]KPF74562.1 hypothetical protein IP68_12420 [Blastomonas sp. AAP25]